MNKKLLLVANVAKEHVLKFHVPTIKKFKEEGWIVDVACAGEEKIPYCDHQYHMNWKRSPFTFKTITGIFELKKIIEKNHYDVVYCHTPVGGFVSRLASIKARKNGTKVVYCAHGLHFYKGAPIINWLVIYPIEKILSYFTDTFITINTEDYKLVKERFNKKLNVEHIHGIGVDFSKLDVENKEESRKKYRKELDIPENATVLIYVAEILKNKNQKMLVNTLKEIHKQDENVYLVLPGPIHDDKELRESITKDIEKYVKILGWREDIGELLNMSDIYVASSIREGFGVNLVEALYVGLPVIATRNRGHVDIFL